MKVFAAALYALVVAPTLGLAAAPPSDRLFSEEFTLTGQLLLPGGTTSRGVEVVVTVSDAGAEAVDRWLLFDEQGHFAYSFRGRLDRLSVSTGIRAELYRLERGDLPAVGEAGQIDLGLIDLRQSLASHRLTVLTAADAPPTEVRVAMTFGLPPVGPAGEPIALGSRQFPPTALGAEIEWLLPHDAKSVYFLVERSRGTTHDAEWLSGPQQLFGPFDADTLPTKLILD